MLRQSRWVLMCFDQLGYLGSQTSHFKFKGIFSLCVGHTLNSKTEDYNTKIVWSGSAFLASNWNATIVIIY